MKVHSIYNRINRLITFLLILSLSSVYIPNSYAQASESSFDLETSFEENQESIDPVQQIMDENPNAILHEPIFPSSYPEDFSDILKKEATWQAKIQQETNKTKKRNLQNSQSPLQKFYQRFPKDGKDLGYPANTMTIGDFQIELQNQLNNEGFGEDFDELNALLDQNYAVLVGKNNIHTIFGHYLDLSGTGVFNAIADAGLLSEGTEVILTDGKGKSRGYELTQVIEFLHPDQVNQYYGTNYMPDLAYYGNGLDMVYIQYCRWDISLGLLITNIGYRTW